MVVQGADGEVRIAALMFQGSMLLILDDLGSLFIKQECHHTIQRDCRALSSLARMSSRCQSVQHLHMPAFSPVGTQPAVTSLCLLLQSQVLQTIGREAVPEPSCIEQ